MWQDKVSTSSFSSLYRSQITLQQEIRTRERIQEAVSVLTVIKVHVQPPP